MSPPALANRLLSNATSTMTDLGREGSQLPPASLPSTSSRVRRTPPWRAALLHLPTPGCSADHLTSYFASARRLTTAEALGLSTAQLRRYHLAVVHFLSSDPNYRKGFVGHSFLWQEVLLVFPGEPGLPPLPVHPAVCRQVVSAGQHLRLETRTAPPDWPLSDLPLNLVLQG